MFGAELVMDDQVIAVLELPKRGPPNIHLFDASSLEFQQTLASPPPLTELLLADNRLFVLWKHGIEIYARSAGARWKAVDRIDDYEWRPFGPDLRNAEWEYFTFDPAASGVPIIAAVGSDSAASNNVQSLANACAHLRRPGYPRPTCAQGLSYQHFRSF